MMISKLYLFVALILFKIFKKIFNYKEGNLDLFSKLSFYIFNSNHPRRLDLYQNFFLSQESWKDKLIYNNKNNFSIDKKLTILKKNINCKKKIIFVGDSNVEFFSRAINNDKSISSKSIYSLWVGAKTILGSTDPNAIKNFRRNLLFAKNFKNNENKIFIFSIGSIDIRCIFYELLQRKIVNNNKELLNLFIKNLRFILTEIKNNIPKKNKILFLGVVNSHLKGVEPKRINILLKYKKKYEFPTFGSENKRHHWTSRVNNIILSECKKKNINFIDLQSIIKKMKVSYKKISFDGIHCYSEEFIEKLYEKIAKEK